MYNSDKDNFEKTNYSNEANFFKLCDFGVIKTDTTANIQTWLHLTSCPRYHCLIFSMSLMISMFKKFNCKSSVI
jgi:hypothetical protein